MFPSNLEKEFEENSVTLHGRLSPWGPAYHTRSSLDPAQKREEKTPYRARNVSIQLSCPYLFLHLSILVPTFKCLGRDKKKEEYQMVENCFSCVPTCPYQIDQTLYSYVRV